MTGKTLEQAHARCSFSDPSIARDAGYVQVTRLNGHGPALLVIPEAGTPSKRTTRSRGRRTHMAALLSSET
jgi:hypothetical protein